MSCRRSRTSEAERNGAKWEVNGGKRKEMGGKRSEMGGKRNEMGGKRNEMGGKRSEMGGKRKEMGGKRSEIGEGAVSPRSSISSLSSSSSSSSGKLYFRKGIKARIRIFCRRCCNYFVKKKERKRLADTRRSIRRSHSLVVSSSLSVIMEQSEEDITSPRQQSDTEIIQTKDGASRITTTGMKDEPLKGSIHSMQPDATDSSTDEDSESWIDDILDNDTTPSESCDSVGESSPEVSVKRETERSQFDDFAPQFSTMALESISKNEGDVDADNTNPVTADEASAAEECDEVTVNVLQKKKSQFEQFTPQFSTMAMEEAAKTKSDLDNEDIILSSSGNSPCGSKSDLTESQSLEKKKSEFAQFAPQFSTMAMESISQEDDVSIKVIKDSDDLSYLPSSENFSQNGNSCLNSVIYSKKELKTASDNSITSSDRGSLARHLTHPFRRLRKSAASVENEIVSPNFASVASPPEVQVQKTRKSICRNYLPASSKVIATEEDDYIAKMHIFASQNGNHSAIDKGEMKSSCKQRDQLQVHSKLEMKEPNIHQCLISHNGPCDAESHVRISKMTSHTRTCDTKSHVRTSNVLPDIRTCDAEFHVRTGTSDVTSHTRTCNTESHVRTSDSTSHTRTSDTLPLTSTVDARACGSSIKTSTQKPVTVASKNIVTSTTSDSLFTNCRKAQTASSNQVYTHCVPTGNLQVKRKDSSAIFGLTRPPIGKISPEYSRDDELPDNRCSLYPPTKCLPDNLTAKQRVHFEKMETTFRERNDDIPNADFWVKLNRKKETNETQEPLFLKTPFGQILCERSEGKCKAQQDKGFFLAASRNMGKQHNKELVPRPMVKVRPLPDITSDASTSFIKPSSGEKQFLIQGNKKSHTVHSLSPTDSEDGRDD